MNDILYIVGQVLSIVAVILGFISFQMKNAKGILAFQIITASVFSLHYLLIGAMTAMMLNLVAAVKCVAYFIRDRRGSKSVLEPIIFTLLVIATSILTWDGWYSVFIMLGLVVNSVSLAFSDPQKTRAAMLIKSPLCLIYNVIVFSTGGIIYECAVLVSSVLGILKTVRAEK